ncbi:MAG: single-stranded DNA-binding protein [Sphingobacteriaceae bacterium]|nr:MAG: single-stranded DNA-binding protein [Sphingobacteriaceae bacterium]
MSGVNKILLVGHLGKDPDFRCLDNQVATVSFPLATSEFVMKDGVRIEHTEWHYVVMWRGLATSAANILKKGMLVYIEGKCRTRSFADREGIYRHTTEIVADYYSILGKTGSLETSGALKK